MEKMSLSTYYKACARRCDGGCSGRITWEHVIIYAGKQLNEIWAIIPLCEKHHGVEHYSGSDSFMDKNINMSIALNRATDLELQIISKSIDYISLRDRLNFKFKGRYISKGDLQTT